MHTTHADLFFKNTVEEWENNFREETWPTDGQSYRGKSC